MRPKTEKKKEKEKREYYGKAQTKLFGDRGFRDRLKKEVEDRGYDTFKEFFKS